VAQVVVGLGNPGPEYHGTRHNLGQRVLDHLAQEVFHSRWRSDDSTRLASGEWRGTPVKLVKPLTFMNVSGPVVRRALHRHRAGPAELILVYDDIDLTLGKVRVRMTGSHGGHNGVRSVIETLDTDAIRRVKIGVGRPDHKAGISDHVLTGFLPEEEEQVAAAVVTAAQRVLELVVKSSG
jgi:peptidyl-tRNA hydrolase, PTH1 family